jgi:L-ascorbate metabolism protein UlaG (beta-lactamase superfamily)
MRWITVCVGLSIFWLGVSAAQDNKQPPVQIAWHGQSFFTVRSSKGTVVAFDPHLIPAYGRPLGLKADIVLTSHNHNDHTQVSVLQNADDKKLRVISGMKGPGLRSDWNLVAETIKDVTIRSVGAYHDASQGMERGKNTIFIVEMDGWRICHLGDLGHTLTPDQVKRIGAVDVLMVPVGGVYTLNGSDAKKVVEQIKPREYILPMHYGTKVFEDLLPIDEFLDGQERPKIAATNDNKVLLNRDPTRPRPLIVQLHYWPKGRQAE